MPDDWMWLDVFSGVGVCEFPAPLVMWRMRPDRQMLLFLLMAKIGILGGGSEEGAMMIAKAW